MFILPLFVSLLDLPVCFCRNWCPHTVTKTVTCQVQNGTILQRVYQTCRWPQGCSGGSYKTVVRPSYKVVYRTVTSLEWKCCPGFSGTGCGEGRRRLKEDFDLGVQGFGCLNCSRITALSEKLNSLEAKVKAVSESLGKIPGLFY
uniref:EMI domain-containing protein n=1 Tax=Xiphophorus couchianus TaxID=32473 RepID=A0A3B5MHV1_9TELE